MEPSSLINKNRINSGYAVKVPLKILTTTLLSLLLPLSFLLLARLSTANYLLSVSNDYPIPNNPSLTYSFFLYTQKPTILHILVSIISISSLTQGVSGKIPLVNDLITRTHLYVAWIFLFVFQICVCLGIEGSIAVGIDGSGFGDERSMIFRMVFFFGLHETMRVWGRIVVKPVVDDTIFGCSMVESWVENVVGGLGYSGLWWWRLREELEALAVVPEVKGELMMGIGVADFVGWWLYYLTLAIGMVRIVKGLITMVDIFMRRRVIEVEYRANNDEKV